MKKLYENAIGNLINSAVKVFLRACATARASIFVRNVIIVTSGSAMAQGITVAFSPLVTRLYGPVAFGELGAFMAILSVIAPLSALAYPMAIVLPKDDGDAISLIKISTIVAALISTISLLILLFGWEWFSSYFNSYLASVGLVLMPVALFLAAGSQILEQWLIRGNAFNIIARITIIATLVGNAGKTLVGLSNPFGSSLILITTATTAVQVGLMSVISIRSERGKSGRQRDKIYATRDLLLLAKKYQDFPLYRAPQNFVNAASQSFPVLILAGLFGASAAGFYTLARLVMGMPSSLIAKAVGDVLYPNFARAGQEKENITKLLLNTTGLLAAIGALPFGLISFFGPWLFTNIFGAEWTEAGEYSRWLALLYFFNFINKPCVAAVPILGIQRGLLVYELFSTASKLLILAAGILWFDSDNVAIALYSIVSAASYCLMMCWIYKQALSWEANGKASK